MKNKFLSIALVLGMLLSLLSSVPVSAETSSTKSLPYAFYDYEDGVKSLVGGKIVVGGMGGSAYCMQYVEKSATYTDRTIIAGNNEEERLKGTIPANHTFKLEFNMKLDQKVTSGNLMLFIYASGGLNTALLGTFDPENTTDWQKMEFSYTPNADWNNIALVLRFADANNNGVYVLGGAKKDARKFFIDDMIASVKSQKLGVLNVPGDEEEEEAVLPDMYSSLANYFMGFNTKRSDGSGKDACSIQRYADQVGDSVNVGPSETGKKVNGVLVEGSQITTAPDSASNKVLKVKHASTFNGYESSIRFGSSIVNGQPNQPTASVVLDVGDTLTYTFSYYIAQEVESGNDPAFCIYHGTGAVFAVSSTPFATEANTWHTATLTYTNDGSTPITLDKATLRFCGDALVEGNDLATNWIKKGHSGYSEGGSDFGERIFYFDNFRIYTSEYENYGQGGENALVKLSLDNYEMNFDNGSSMQNEVAGEGAFNTSAEEKGTDDEKTQIVSDPDDSENAVLKVWLSSNISGEQSTLKFSESTAADENVPTATGTIPAEGSITYAFRYYLLQDMEDNNPEFSVAHETGDVLAVSSSSFETTANQWHTATLTYTNNTKNDIQVGGAVLRYCGADLDEGGNQTNWKVKNHLGDGYGERVIYFDDFKVVTEEPKFPVSDELVVCGEFATGNKVMFTQNFTASTGNAADLSIVKLMYTTEDGFKASHGSCRIGEEFTVPEILTEGAYSFEVVPVDSNNKMGMASTYSYAKIVGQEIELKLSDFDADGNTTATVTIDNQRRDGSDINAILIVELFNADGGVVKCGFKAFNCSNGTSIEGEAGKLVVLTDNADASSSEVKSAKALLWDCADAQEPSFSNTTLDELAPDVFVVKQ